MQSTILYKEEPFPVTFIEEDEYNANPINDSPVIFRSTKSRKEPRRLVEYSLYFRPISVQKCQEARERGLPWIWNEDEFGLLKAKKGLKILQRRYNMKTPGDLCIVQARRLGNAPDDIALLHKLLEEELFAGKLENQFGAEEIATYLADPNVHAYVLESQKRDKRGIFNLAFFKLDTVFGLQVSRILHLTASSIHVVGVLAWTLLKAQSLGLDGVIIPNYAYLHSKLEYFHMQEIGKEAYYSTLRVEETPTHESTLMF